MSRKNNVLVTDLALDDSEPAIMVLTFTALTKGMNDTGVAEKSGGFMLTLNKAQALRDALDRALRRRNIGGS